MEYKKMKRLFTTEFLQRIEGREVSFFREQKCTFLLHDLGVDEPKSRKLLLTEIKDGVENKRRFAACADVLSEMGANNLRYACVKGPVLSKIIYGDETWRSYHDLDVLVDEKDMDFIKQILAEHGFKAGKKVEKGKVVPYTREEKIYILSLTHQTEPYFRRLGDFGELYAEIDLNTNVHWEHANLFTPYCLRHLEQIEIFGYTVKKLAKEEEFLALCLHHYRDMNSPYMLKLQGIRLAQLCDIYFYVNNVNVDWNRLIKLCGEYDLGRYVFFCLSMCVLVFQDDKLSACLDLLSALQCERQIGYFGMKERFRWKSEVLDLVGKTDVSSEMLSVLSAEEKQKLRRLDLLWSRK